ncbi:MAG TPA: four helix bundle protein [Patescibacteria group bacterium]|nr:four helix bundle protein [Patescibacteria group bacterium]
MAFLDFTELDVWKQAHEIRLKVFTLCNFLPKTEFDLIRQIKRSSHSVGANIAEGYGRFHYQENIQYCRQSRGSLEETRDHLIYIKDTKMIKKVSSIEHLIQLCLECKIKLNGYIAYLKKAKLGGSDTNNQ